MLGKLIKHEFKSTSRTFLALYAIVLIITVILKGVVEVQYIFNVDNIIMTMLTAVTILAFIVGIIAVILGSFVLVIKRFYDNLLKDEGYLSFTLPVSIGQHIASKSIVGYIWMILSGVVVFLLFCVLGLGHNEMIGQVREAFFEVIEEINQSGGMKYVIETLTMLMFSVYANIAMGYASFSIGQTFGKNKVLGAFLSYIAIYFVMQIISSIAMVIIFGSNMSVVNDTNVGDALFQPLMIFSFGLIIVQIIAYVIITHVMLNKKLNLQ
jgi:uncharacterized membrane protein YhaH (DUF805 family)